MPGAPVRQLHYPLIWFFTLTFALTFVGQWAQINLTKLLSAPPMSMSRGQILSINFYVTNIGPSLVGVLMIAYMYGFAGIKKIAAKLSPLALENGWKVVAICLLAPPLFEFLLFTIFNAPAHWDISSYIYGAVISGGLIGSGICEEIGWRGFALPHLQRRYSALTSSIIVGAAWGLWHWPNVFNNSQPNPILGLLTLIPAGIVLACLYTWAYNSTNGSLLTVVILHGTTVTRAATPRGEDPVNAIVAATVIVILVVVIVWKYGAGNMSWRNKVTLE